MYKQERKAHKTRRIDEGMTSKPLGRGTWGVPDPAPQNKHYIRPSLEAVQKSEIICVPFPLIFS